MRSFILTIVVFTSGLVLAQAPSKKDDAAQTTVAGSWNGLLKIHDGTTHFVLHVRNTDENLSATADLPDQCRYVMPVDSMILSGQNLHFKIAKLKIEFTGTFSSGGISGVFKQNKVSIPLTLNKSDASSEVPNSVANTAACVAGTWKGVVAFPGGKIPIVLHVTGSNENLSATLDDLHAARMYGIRVDAIVLNSQEFSFTIVKYGVMFNGRFSDGTISGTFYQNGFTVPLKLLRSD